MISRRHAALALTALAAGACRAERDAGARASAASVVTREAPASGSAGLTISSAGLAGIPLCAPLSSVARRFPDARDTLIAGEGASWRGRIVRRPEGSRLLFESSWADTLHVWRSSTDSRDVRGPAGLRVGAELAPLLAAGEPVEVQEPEGVLLLEFTRHGVAVVVDDSGAAAFFRRQEAALGGRGSATIEPQLAWVPASARVRMLAVAGGCPTRTDGAGPASD